MGETFAKERKQRLNEDVHLEILQNLAYPSGNMSRLNNLWKRRILNPTCVSSTSYIGQSGCPPIIRTLMDFTKQTLNLTPNSPLQNRGVVLAVSVLALAFWDTALLWCAFFYYAIKVVSRLQYPSVLIYWSPTDFSQVDPWPSQSQHLNMITPCFHAFSQIANTASVRKLTSLDWGYCRGYCTGKELSGSSLTRKRLQWVYEANKCPPGQLRTSYSPN